MKKSRTQSFRALLIDARGVTRDKEVVSYCNPDIQSGWVGDHGAEEFSLQK
jgi:hypothetical protein